MASPSNFWTVGSTEPVVTITCCDWGGVGLSTKVSGTV